MGVDEVLILSKEDLCDLSHKNDDGDVVHLKSIDAGRTRMLLHYKRHIVEQDFHRDNGSFRFTSITMND